MQDQNNLFSNSDDRQENLFPDFSIASININNAVSPSESYLKSSPFGDDSLFTSPKPNQFYEGNTKFIEILWFIGAPMIENNDENDNEGNLLEEVVVTPGSNSQKPYFDYRKYITGSDGNNNSWSFRDSNFAGKAILNKILGYIDKEKIFLFTNGSGYARYSLYVPYSNDSRVSLNNVDKKYIQSNAAIIINQLDTDGLLIILNNLHASKRNSYVEAIYKVLAKEVEVDILDNPNALYIINDFPIALLKYFKYKTLEAILFGMLKDYLNDDKEAVLLKLFRVLYVKPDFDAQHFLNVLLTEKINGQSAFQVLYDNMNDWGGENNFSKIIIELAKIWTLSDYCNPNLSLFKKYEPCIDLVYDQEIILGFRVDEYAFDFDKGNHVIMTKNPNPQSGSKPLDYLYGQVMEEKHKYHPFQPVTISSLKETEIEDLKLVENASIPAFYLKAFDDKGVWENFEKGIWLVVDFVSIFTGIGNLAKLRYLIKTEKIAVIVLKTSFAVIEVASSTVSIGLALVENSKNKDVVNKIREYLFWAEICTLSADVLSSRILAKKASEASEVLTGYRKTIKNKKHLKEIDEFKAHLDDIIEYIPNQLLRKEIRYYKGVEYEISIYTKKIEWNFLKIPNSKLNRMDIDEYGFISFDFNIPEKPIRLVGQGFGKQFVEETFEVFDNRIKGAKASWNESVNYPDGSAHGFKQFWKVFEATSDKIEALKSTDFYKIMEKKNISKIESNASISIDVETNSVDVIIYR